MIEFALLAPALMTMLLGLFELGYNYYVNTQMHGAIQKAARDITIEGSNDRFSDIDERVSSAVRIISPDAEISFSRNSYKSYSEVGRPEDFTDTNGDGKCNDGEPFEDVNGNNVWDIGGVEGAGGARDAVMYSVHVTYPRTFGVSKLIGLSDTVEMTATTILRNQPYEKREVAQPTVGNC